MHLKSSSDWMKNDLINGLVVLGKLDIPVKESETWSLSLTLYKYQLQRDQGP